jgi:hypothetical protein
MHCESAVCAVTSDDFLLSACQGRPQLGVACHAIHGLGVCGIPKMITHPSTNFVDRDQCRTASATMPI